MAVLGVLHVSHVALVLNQGCAVASLMGWFRVGLLAHGVQAR